MNSYSLYPKYRQDARLMLNTLRSLCEYPSKRQSYTESRAEELPYRILNRAMGHLFADYEVNGIRRRVSSVDDIFLAT